MSLPVLKVSSFVIWTWYAKWCRNVYMICVIHANLMYPWFAETHKRTLYSGDWDERRWRISKKGCKGTEGIRGMEEEWKFSKANIDYRRITDSWLCVYFSVTSCGWLSTQWQNGGLCICLDGVPVLLFQQQVSSYLLLLLCKSTDNSRRSKKWTRPTAGSMSFFCVSNQSPHQCSVWLIFILSLCRSPSSIPVKTSSCPAQENLIWGLKGYQVRTTSLEVHLCFKDLLAPEIHHHAEEFDPWDCAVWINVHPRSIRGMDWGHGTKASPWVQRWAWTWAPKRDSSWSGENLLKGGHVIAVWSVTDHIVIKRYC